MTPTVLRQPSLVQAPAGARVTVDQGDGPAAAAARELLGLHARAGLHVAQLDSADAAVWETARPVLASLAAHGRETSRRLAAACGRTLPGGDVPALTEADRVAPVVWAREIGSMQGLLRRALRDVELDRDGGRTVAVLRNAVWEARCLTAALAVVVSMDA